ncbi:nuclear transport factor 2 family protein [Chitinophagaceae bacterium LWZ2-11]
MKKQLIIILFAGLVICHPLNGHAQAQTPSQPSLTAAALQATILRDDSLFWQAYNHCDITGMKTYLTTDCEFYHDKGGLTKGLDALMQIIATGICKEPNNYSLRREAVPATVNVYPLSKNDVIYGAVISGEHLFYIHQSGKAEYLDGHARFTHLWLLTNGEWKMARVLSFDHHPATYISQKKAITLPDSLLHSYAGKYRGPQNILEIKPEAGGLALLIKEKAMSLYPETEIRFFSKERDLTFEFTKDAGTGRQKMIVYEHGAITEELIKE